MITAVTQRARDMVTEYLVGTPLYATLHSSEPVINDPAATQIRMSGSPAVRAVMAHDGAEMWNAVKISFSGILPGQIGTHLALCETSTGQGILFYGEIPVQGAATPLWDYYEVEPEKIRIAVI